jgi:hypothetical protein
MHAALAFLLVLTVHRCYPAGVPRFLQGNLTRRQIRSYPQTLCILWAFAILINLPLFAITNYENNLTNVTENNTNLTYTTSEPTCFTGATEIWSRTYLILLLVLTYLITGIFLIIIYGQVIRIILASKKCGKNPVPNTPSNNDHSRFLSPNIHNDDKYRSKLIRRTDGKGNGEIPPIGTSSSSSSINELNRRYQQNSSHTAPVPLVICTTAGENDLNKSSTNSHSAQHLQVIVMLFIVILLYILLLLPYRLLNLLYIVHNQLFQQSFMNEFLFQWLLNTVRLLVFLNCALQPITYLIISSRLRQTVIKLLQSSYKCYCSCEWLSSPETERHYKGDNRAIRTYISQNTNRCPKQQFYRDCRPLQTSLNNINISGYHGLPLPSARSPSPLAFSRSAQNNLYAVSFNNEQRR